MILLSFIHFIHLLAQEFYVILFTLFTVLYSFYSSQQFMISEIKSGFIWIWFYLTFVQLGTLREFCGTFMEIG